MKKFVLSAVVILLLGIAGGAWWLYSSLDSLVASAIRTYGPEITGVTVKLDGVAIKPTEGSAELRGLVLGNPAGFKTPRALSLGAIQMKLDTDSLTKDVILIHELTIAKPEITYEQGNGSSNMETIQRHVEKYVADATGGKPEAKEDKKKEPGKKLVIEHVYIKDAKAEVSAELLKGKVISVPIADLHLTDIGKKTNGATAAEAAKQILGAMTNSVTKAASSVFSGAVEGVKKGADVAGSKIKGLFK